MKQVIAAYTQTKSQAISDSAQALSDYKDKLTTIRLNTQYCERYAKCQPTKPQKATFDGCYSVLSDTDDNNKEDR
jgi:hypothetical protein